MSATAMHDEIPESVLDAAFHWAVVLHSGTAGEAERRDFEAWLAARPAHRSAWRRVQAVEQELDAVRPAAGRAAETLHRMADRRDRQRRFAAGLGCLVVTAMLVGLLVKLSPVWQPWRAQHVTATAERRALTLPGGARVHMNSGTALDIERGEAGTAIRLHRGKILVDSGSAAPADKPRVVTRDGRFTPLGTRFVVARQSGATELAVIHGRVAVEAGAGQPTRARAGQRWRVADGRTRRLAPDGLAPGAWADGIVDADNARLGDVLAALGEYRRGRLRCDPAAADLRVTGIFRLDDTDAALAALARSLPVQIDRVSGWWVSVRAE